MITTVGNEMRETGTEHWLGPNTWATNSSGFTGLGGGRRANDSPAFYNLKKCGYFWTSTLFQQNISEANYRVLPANDFICPEGHFLREYGHSLHCLQDGSQ
ncbi:MAG: hypothetical protein WCK09_09050 [Bacteroidota bacterium]